MLQRVKRLPTMRETLVRSLGREDPLEKEMTTHSSILAWKIPWTEEPGRLQSMGLQRVRHDWATSLHFTRFVIAILPRNKRLSNSWLQSPSAVILESKKMKSVTVSIVSPSICHEVMGPNAMIFMLWMLSGKSAFSLSSYTFIKRLFSSSSLSAMRVISSAYLRLLIFSTEISIPVCTSSILAFHMMCSAYTLNKRGDKIQPWFTPFPVRNQCVVTCPVLTVASWPVYRFLRRQLRQSGIPISLRIFHSLLWYTQSKKLA